MLGSKPPCDIAIDGASSGLTTPQIGISLAPGVHTVRLSNRALGVDKRFKVRIARGETTRVVQDLLD
jgi:hypothetical protein